MKTMIKNLIIVVFISGLSGCQIYPSITENDLGELSNDDLCRALGTYNDDGRLVLKIYDEFKKRPEKPDPERCRKLEYTEKKQQHKNNKTKINEIIPNQPLSNDKLPQYIDPEHHKIIYNHRENNQENDREYNRRNNRNDILGGYKKSMDDVGRISNTYGLDDVFEKNRIDMKDKDISELMKDCLKKHIPNPHSNEGK